jgi:hypothetical protein
MTVEKEMKLRSKEADALLDILEEIVVSLDQIGSRQAAGEDAERKRLQEYFTTGGATRRLAHTRGIVLAAF